MRSWLLVATLLGGLVASAAEPLQPEQVYRVVESGGATFLAPGVAFAGLQEALAVVPAPSLEACASECRREPLCHAFEWCSQEGCLGAEPKLKYHDCRLMASNCTVLMEAYAAGPWVSRVSGFPLRHTPVELPDFTTSPALVLDGGDFDCPGSVLPGRCAFDSVLSAVSICSGMARCRSVLHYHNGTDGCSDPVAVLVTSWPTDTNSYVASTVDTLTKNSDRTVTSLLMATDGVVLEPTAAELATAANASDPSTAWLGCIVADGALMEGTVVAVESGMATAEDCCRACRADSKCNVWNYCGQPGGCSFAASSPVAGNFTVNLTEGQCELRYQETVATGWPPIVLAKGSGVPVISGAPLAVTGPQLPGFVALPGRVMFDYGVFQCPESAWPELKQCILVDQPAQLAEECSANPNCVSMMVFPMPGPPSPVRVGNLRSAFNANLLGLSPKDLTYVRKSELQGSSGGLSGGAIAGIAVGACAAAAALAGAAWLALRRRQRQRRPLGSSSAGGGGTKQPAAGGSSGAGAANGSTHTCSAGGTEDPASSILGPTCSSCGLAAPSVPAPGSDGPQPGPAAEVAGVLPPAEPAVLPPAEPAALLRAGPPPMRAAWNPSHMPSPFAAQAAMPFGATEPQTVESSSVALTPGARSRRINSSRTTGLLPITAAAAAAAAAATAAAVADGSASGPGSSGHGSYSQSSEEQPLPELAQYVAQCDASRSAGLRGASSLAQELTAISIDSLPPSLRGSVVDVSQIRLLTDSAGQLQELGRGASGIVYRALYLNEIVAAKEIDIGSSRSMQEAFVNEALRLHQLHHPHVVALLGVTIAGSTGILLMEYCAGRDLRSALGLTAADANERLFGWHRRGRRVVLEVARALNFLHARGVVHMDVKSNNVLLTSGGTAKLADVGLARLQTGTYLSDVPLIGTFAWVAPEVLMGGQQCTSAVDIFSLGVVMWEVITGERPQRGSLRAPRVPEECPQEVADLMMECLRLEPSQRPTASQVVQRLDSGQGQLEATSVVVPVRAAAGAVHMSDP